MEANDLVEDALYQAAISGNVRAIEIWLYNRSPEKWADRRQSKVEMTGKEGEPLTIKVELMDDE